MRAILTDLHARLSAALPAGTPVLLPEQRELPLQGRKPGQAGGLSGYLEGHPGGYVQLEDAQGLTGTLGGAAGLWLVQLACIAPTPTTADDLAQRALQIVATRAGTRQTPYELTSPASGRALSPLAHAFTFILTARKGL